MARYTDHDEIAAEALQLCEEIRDRAPLHMYRRLAAHCHRDPERMAQVIMALAAMVNDEESLAAMAARIVAITTAPPARPRPVVA
ncbi:hypothetical protein [Nocardia cyriacigeorgica]|uniref:hypothetical protein n=1 Tax=Nocardia cyriacigeorgica TaxID=135487 RepID=UPI001894A31B|nr:hypothetical protein [Nocardia cyriacigeorgica]MBF6289280.1 hypothetical protein [Nocardia cyriacigeorgica]